MSATNRDLYRLLRRSWLRRALAALLAFVAHCASWLLGDSTLKTNWRFKMAYKISIKQTETGFRATSIINFSELAGGGLSTYGAVANLLDRANQIGGWTAGDFDLASVGMVGSLDRETNRHFVTTKEIQDLVTSYE